eukprot:CCRYP_010749-RA/>CCRYP_010749-RA protein AED:0.19 eAED:0.19 QI:0/-1/0/1/-1/1/1/0/302
MASITNSLFPSFHSRPKGRTEAAFPFAAVPNRKRRPIDPPEEGMTFNDSECYASPSNAMESTETMVGAKSPNKRMRTVDTFLDSLTLRAADPPGRYSKRMGDTQINDEGGHGTVFNHPTATMEHATSNSILPSYCALRTKNDASISCASTMTTSNKRPNRTENESFPQLPFNKNKKQYQYSQREQSTSGLSDTGNSEMSLEGSDIDSDCSIDSSSSSTGSVSESSIRNAMYQVVFGRRKVYSSCGGNGNCGGGRMYDVVDSKIEDLIRRSRMEAVINCCKEKKDDERKDDDGDDVEKGMDLD